MAIMIPSELTYADFHGSVGESKIFEAFKALNDDYIIFHSVAWHQRNNAGHIQWGEADFTIFHVKRGLIVLEVKSGGIKIENGKWKQINTLNGEVYNMKDPLVQANRSKYTFIDLLSENFALDNEYRIEVAVAFPSISKPDIPEVLPPLYANELIITESDLSNIKAAIDRIFNYYKLFERSHYTSNDKNNCIRTLSPEFSVVPNLKQRINEEDYVFNRLTQEQNYLLDYLTEQRTAAIQGGAGTGKTILAVEKAIGLSKNEKVLFLCFNKFLLDSLRTLHSEKNPNIDFYNLATLAQYKTTLHTAWSNDGIFNFLNSYDQYDWDYKHIIIDEAQDFLSEQIELLEAIAEVNEGCIYAFYDKNQLIHNRNNDALKWLDLFDCRLVLFTNCRNTKSIAATAYRPIGIEEVKTRNSIVGLKPNFHITRTHEKMIDSIAEIIDKYIESGISKNDIVILTIKTEETSVLSDMNKIGGHKIKCSLDDKGILFTTSRKFKGLEAAVVIVVDVDDITFSNEDYCKVLYVATSRAKHFLDIVSIVDDQKIENISTYITGGAHKKPKVAISNTLKVKIVDR